MKKICWAVKTVHGFVQDNYDPYQPVRTIFFRTRKHAKVWLEDNHYWVRLKAEPVKVKVTVAEYGL